MPRKLLFLFRKYRSYIVWGLGGALVVSISAAATMVLLKSGSSRPVPIPQSRRQAHNILSPTPAPLQPNYYITVAQKFLTKAEEYSQTDNQTAQDKEKILAAIQNALTVINQGVRNYPQDDRLYAQRAKIYQGIINFSPKAINNALADLDKAHQLSPENPIYPKKQSQLLAQAGRHQDAAYYANIAYQLEPSDLQNLVRLGEIQVQAGQIKAAVKSYQQLLGLLPETDENTNQIQQELNNLENLLAQADTSLQLAGTSPQPTPNQNYIPADIQLLPKKEAGLPDNLIIAAPEENQSQQKDKTDLNAASGEAVLKTNEAEITIPNHNVTNNSQILLSPISDTENQSLYIKEKDARSDEPYFTVGIHHPITSDIEFKWWIVGE